MIGADALLVALAAADGALARGDAAGAGAALADAEGACAAFSAADQRLPPELLARARELHARGAATAAAHGERLARELDQAGSARRAVSAYRR